MEKTDLIFLAKLQQVMTTLNELDDIAKRNPTRQQMIDYEISDYLHLLQNEDLSDEKILELSKRLKQARLTRVSLFNTSELIKTYMNNNKVLIYSEHRHKLKDAIEEKMKTLNNNYNYRILEQEDVDSFKECIVVETKVRKRRGKYEITKEMLEERFEKGMKNKDIAEELGCEQSYISVLKKKFGLGMREYKKRGE
jgi:hypothetical protein